jgi:hypothetical protein
MNNITSCDSDLCTSIHKQNSWLVAFRLRYWYCMTPSTIRQLGPLIRSLRAPYNASDAANFLSGTNLNQLSWQGVKCGTIRHAKWPGNSCRNMTAIWMEAPARSAGKGPKTLLSSWQGKTHTGYRGRRQGSHGWTDVRRGKERAKGRENKGRITDTIYASISRDKQNYYVTSMAKGQRRNTQREKDGGTELCWVPKMCSAVMILHLFEWQKTDAWKSNGFCLSNNGVKHKLVHSNLSNHKTLPAEIL